MIHRYHHNLSFFTHIFPFIGNVLDGGACKKAAPVEPYHDRVLLSVKTRRPDIQILAVLIHHPIAVGNQKFSVWPIHIHKRTDIAKACSLLHPFPGINRLRRMEPSGFCVGNALKDKHAVVEIAADAPLVSLHDRGFVIVNKFFPH